MSTYIHSEPFEPFHDVYDEEDCETDNEEEVKHDLVTCPKCSTKTHYLNEECGKCGNKFKISKAGYVLTGEDGDFLCDEDDEIEECSDGYETPDIDKMSVSDSESDGYDTADTGFEDEDGDEDLFCVDDSDYTLKKDMSDVVAAPRRITRSMVIK